jgi:hypothetical protein
VNLLAAIAEEGVRTAEGIAAGRRVAAIAADLPAADTAVDHWAVAIAADLPAVDTAVGHRVVAMAADLPVADPAVDRRVVVIVAGLPAADPAADPPAEALRLRAAILRQSTIAADSSPAGMRPASSHRSPSGGSEGSLLLSLRMRMERRELIPQRSVQ